MVSWKANRVDEYRAALGIPILTHIISFAESDWE